MEIERIAKLARFLNSGAKEEVPIPQWEKMHPEARKLWVGIVKSVLEAKEQLDKE